jgi:hypothetical protein
MAQESPSFNRRTDQNGVPISTNARPADEYDPPARDLCPGQPRYRESPDGRGYIEAPPSSLIARQRERSLNQLGSSQAMTWQSDLLPRTARVDNGQPAYPPHDANCYCNQCHPMIGTANTAAPQPY